MSPISSSKINVNINININITINRKSSAATAAAAAAHLQEEFSRYRLGPRHVVDRGLRRVPKIRHLQG